MTIKNSKNGQTCAVKLTTRHRMEDEMDEFYFEQMGQLVQVNGNYYIQFVIENEEDEDLSVTFKIARDGSVTLIRRGSNSSRMRFNAEKNTSMRYHIPEGSVLIDIDTQHVRIEYQNQPFSGKVTISYDLYSGPQLIGNYDLELHFTV
ncbi:MAG: DUF1934 domain-containing protein [Atopococcus tabaci]|uniref:DUF1934 domain-containing protein n=1 Tax=Atopococcus tabaci TaxID=269774 RepID=A0AA43UCY1_9LACT|nr:DUF1934 domain-containing protein [Atopococcus tabaci]